MGVAPTCLQLISSTQFLVRRLRFGVPIHDGRRSTTFAKISVIYPDRKAIPAEIIIRGKDNISGGMRDHAPDLLNNNRSIFVKMPNDTAITKTENENQNAAQRNKLLVGESLEVAPYTAARGTATVSPAMVANAS